jgi:peptidoglycan/xylan/chitin deacetylase (PgdA/CDA1 family)
LFESLISRGETYAQTGQSALQTLVLLVVILSGWIVVPAQTSSKEIAVTIDDLPLNGPRFDLARMQTMTTRLLSEIRGQHVPVVGFVNESLLYVPNETDARIALLEQWAAGGVELGNHTFAHVGFKDTPLSEYEDDFVRGETITRAILQRRGQKPEYFRHPFLQMGPTRELEESFEKFIAVRGYRIAPVTIDIMDWMFRVAYANARTRNDAGLMQKVAGEYLKFAAVKIEYCESVARELFGRPIKHILLLHANELNADNFGQLVKLFTERGYRFITLKEALTDPVYQAPDKYKATSDWLNQWSFSKGKQFTAPAPPEFIQKAYAESSKPTS